MKLQQFLDRQIMANVYLINTETMEWPIYEGDFRAQNSGNSYPNPLVNPPEPYAWVNSTPQPAYNVMTQGCQEITPKEIGLEWLQQWEIYGLTPEEIAENENTLKQTNKEQAESLLQATDWTATVDISNPEYSDPYLVNQDAFLAYRSNVRKIAVNPPVTVNEWPVKPDEVWVTV